MNEEPNRVSKSALLAMLLIVAALGFVALLANWEKARRGEIESVTLTRFTPTPAPSHGATP